MTCESMCFPAHFGWFFFRGNAYTCFSKKKLNKEKNVLEVKAEKLNCFERPADLSFSKIFHIKQTKCKYVPINQPSLPKQWFRDFKINFTGWLHFSQYFEETAKITPNILWILKSKQSKAGFFRQGLSLLTQVGRLRVSLLTGPQFSTAVSATNLHKRGTGEKVCW